MKKILYLFIIFLLIGCSDSSKSNLPPARTLYVKTAPVIQENVPVYIEAIGNVYPSLTVGVKPQVEGKLIAVHVKEGQDVDKGQLLYTIDPSIYQAAVDKAKGNVNKSKAALKLAEDRVKRYSELVKSDYVSQLAFDEYKTDVLSTQAQLQVAFAELDLAKINLGYTSVRSPIEGRIGQYMVDVGNIVKADSNAILTTVRKIAPAYVNFAIPQNNFWEVKKAFGERPLIFEAILPDDTSKVYEGTVFFVDNAVDIKTGTLLMKGQTLNEKKELWPGAFVRVRLLLDEKKNALTVPLSAIQYGQEGTYVYVLNPDQTVSLHPVTTSVKYGNNIVVEEGIKYGEIVIVDGQINLRPGVKVVVENDVPPRGKS